MTTDSDQTDEAVDRATPIFSGTDQPDAGHTGGIPLDLFWARLDPLDA